MFAVPVRVMFSIPDWLLPAAEKVLPAADELGAKKPVGGEYPLPRTWSGK